MDLYTVVASAVCVLLLMVCLALLLQRNRLRQQLSPLTNVALEAERAKAELNAELERGREQIVKLEQEAAAQRAVEKEALLALQSRYTESKNLYDRLLREISLLEEILEDESFGLYKPHFDYDASDDYRAALGAQREHRTQMVRQGTAVKCDIDWQIGGSKKEGDLLVKQLSKLMLRAFNAEVDAALTNVRWNNISKMEARLAKAFKAINDSGKKMKIALTDEYLEACVAELRLTHEFNEKRHAEREEQRQIREQMREEERTQRELERARQEAEEDERRYRSALERARAEAQLLHGSELADLNLKIESLEQKLLAAQTLKERALSQAQQTKRGHVYIISNVGSFGPDVFKIGLTRRLEPMDRVRELGDASVPFSFDVHAMVYSDDAPALETALHRHFEPCRVNLINPRKEFFSLDFEELEKFTREKGLDMQLTKLAEAREYRESLALRRERVDPAPRSRAREFPDTLDASAPH